MKKIVSTKQLSFHIFVDIPTSHKNRPKTDSYINDKPQPGEGRFYIMGAILALGMLSQLSKIPERQVGTALSLFQTGLCLLTAYLIVKGFKTESDAHAHTTTRY